MRHTHAHTRNRRSHHALAAIQLSICKDCGKSHLRHTTCQNCGKYKGVQVIDVAARALKKENRAKVKAKSLGIDPEKAKIASAEKK